MSEEKRQVKLTLPFPPTTNHLYFSFVRKGKIIRVPTDETKAFKKKVAEQLTGLRLLPFFDAIKVTQYVYRPAYQGDWDNYTKAAMDSLKRSDTNKWGLFIDDSQIVEGHIYRLTDQLNPRTEVILEEV